MCKIQMKQEDSSRVLAVGHKVIYDGREATIDSIRVWHDLDTLLTPKRFEPVCDLQFQGGHMMNVRFGELRLWRESVLMPVAGAIPTPDRPIGGAMSQLPKFKCENCHSEFVVAFTTEPKPQYPIRHCVACGTEHLLFVEYVE